MTFGRFPGKPRAGAEKESGPAYEPAPAEIREISILQIRNGMNVIYDGYIRTVKAVFPSGSDFTVQLEGGDTMTIDRDGTVEVPA